MLRRRRFIPFTNSLLSHFTEAFHEKAAAENVFPFFLFIIRLLMKWEKEENGRKPEAQAGSRETPFGVRTHGEASYAWLLIYVNLWLLVRAALKMVAGVKELRCVNSCSKIKWKELLHLIPFVCIKDSLVSPFYEILNYSRYVLNLNTFTEGKRLTRRLPKWLLRSW